MYSKRRLKAAYIAGSRSGLDVLILHELAHTRVKNHGKEFWTLMDELVGDGKAKAKRVREYSIRHLLGSP